MMKSLFVAAALILSASFAQARPAAPLWACALSAPDINGQSIGLGFNLEVLQGYGEVTCQSLNGYVATTPVEVTIKAFGLGLGFSKTKGMGMITQSVGVADPKAMAGEFKLGALVGGTLIAAGGGVDVSVLASGKGLGFELGLIGARAYGLEAKVQGRKMTIQPVGKTVIRKKD